MNAYSFESIKLTCPDTLSEIKKLFDDMISDKKTKYISFINPEIFMQQQKDDLLHNYFVNSRYNFIDGVGLLLAINKKIGTSYNSQNRYTGTDFFNYLPEKDVKIFLYGSKPGNAELAKEKIELQHSNVKIVGTFDGYTKISDEELIKKINDSTPDILIVCTGCPRQEYWINNNLEFLKVPVVFGNGGSIDFWSGKVKRAPLFMRKLGLEFVFRLFQNFTFARIKRQSKLLKFLFCYKTGIYEIKQVDDM